MPMASAKAIPIIAIVKMFPNAPGLRPTASAAFAPTKPTPIPAPPPANARGKVAAMFPLLAASANIGSNSSVILSSFLAFWIVLYLVYLAAHALGWSRQERDLNAPRLHWVRHGQSTAGYKLRIAPKRPRPVGFRLPRQENKTGGGKGSS